MYTNVHLVDDEGCNVVVFVAYFTQGLRLATVRRFDPQWRLLDEYTGTTVGLLRPKADHHELSFRHPHGNDRWHNIADEHGQRISHASRLTATGPGFSVDLELRPLKAPYHAGDPGVLPFSERGWFYYYSLTRLTASGTVTLGDVPPRTRAVEGRAWVDHQWGPFFVTPFRNPRVFEQYEWFSLQLSNGCDVVLTTVWNPDGSVPATDGYGGAGLMRGDGSTARLVGPQRLRRTHFHRDASTGGVYSAGWRFVAPEWDCDLTIRPRHLAQMTPIAAALPKASRWSLLRQLAPLADVWGAFWEGSCSVQGRFEGVEVDGDGFAELVKRYAAPKVVLEVPLIRTGGARPVVVLRWRVLNRDPAVDLRFRVRVYAPDGRLLTAADDVDLSVFCFDDDGTARGPCQVLVEAHSADHALRGEARSTVELGAGRHS